MIPDPAGGTGDYVRNRILRNLEPRELELILPQLEKVGLPVRTLVHEAGGVIGHVYFVESGTVSMIARLPDGSQAEVGLIGREGLVGLPPVLGGRLSVLDALVQIEGTARRMAVPPFRRAMQAIPHLREAMLGYVEAFHAQVSQTAACNSWHSIDRRLARWLLMTADRVEDDQFAMTQEFMAKMLAVQRPGVTLATKRLQQAGLIRHQRGWLRILDRDGLEAASCACYGRVRDHCRSPSGEARKISPVGP